MKGEKGEDTSFLVLTRSLYNSILIFYSWENKNDLMIVSSLDFKTPLMN